MDAGAKLFIEQGKDDYVEIGGVVQLGEIGFFDKKSIFTSEPTKRKKHPLKTCIGAMAMLVSTDGNVDWAVEIKDFGKKRRRFRVEYPDGELHTMDCVALAPGGHSPYLHVQLHLCTAPVIERVSA